MAAPAIAPATSAAPASSGSTLAKTTPVTKRLYISGLNETVTLSDLEARFKTFGEVRDVTIPQPGPLGCRGFGYVTLNTNVGNFHKCLTLYNGAKWKGMKLKVEEAKEDYLARLKREWAKAVKVPQPAEGITAKAAISKKKRKRLLIDEADDMSLVTDSNVGMRKGWKRSRYGRAVAVIHVRDKITRKIITIDPLKYKNNILKLDPRTPDVPVTDLTWPEEHEQEEVPPWAAEVAVLVNDGMAKDDPWAWAFAHAAGVIEEPELEEPELDEEQKEEEQDAETAMNVQEEDDQTSAHVESPAPQKSLDEDSQQDLAHNADEMEDAGIQGDEVDASESKIASRADSDVESEDGNSPNSYVPRNSLNNVITFDEDSDDDVGDGGDGDDMEVVSASYTSKPKHHETSLFDSDSESDEEEVSSKIPTPPPKAAPTPRKRVIAAPLPPGLSDSDSDADILPVVPTLPHHSAAKDNKGPSTAGEREKLLGVAASILAEEKEERKQKSGNVVKFDDSDDDEAGSGRVVSFESDEDEEEDPTAVIGSEPRDAASTSSESEEEDSESSQEDNGNNKSDSSEESGSDDSEESSEGGDEPADGGDDGGKDSDDSDNGRDDKNDEDEEEEEESEDEDSDTPSDEEEEGKTNKTEAEVLAAPRAFKVNTNLRSLVFGASEDNGGFSLFGGQTPAPAEDEEMLDAPSATPAFRLFEDKMDVDEGDQGEEGDDKAFDEAEVAKSFSTSKMFFLHLGNEGLAHRSNYSPDNTFMRRKTLEEINADWEENRGELTQDYKRKHKSAFRRREKMKRKRTKVAGTAAE